MIGTVVEARTTLRGEDLAELNDSWATEVSGITEQEVQEQVSVYLDEFGE